MAKQQDKRTQHTHSRSMSKNEKIHANKRNIKRRKKRRDSLVFAFVIFLLAALGAVLPLTVFFNIAAFEISGSSYYSNDEIIRASGLEIGSNMMRMKKGDVEAEIERLLPYIGEAQIKRSLPDTLEIIITDTHAELAIEDGSGYTLLNVSGKILETGVSAIPDGVAAVKGFYVKELSAGSNISDYGEEEETSGNETSPAGRRADNASALNALNTIAQAVKDTELDDISVYDLSDLSDIQLIYQNRLKILLGTVSNIENKLRLGKEAIERKNQTNPQYEGVVDLITAREAYIRDEEHETYTMSPEETSIKPPSATE